MKKIISSMRSYLYNSDIDLNERLSRFFIYIGIIAAVFGTGICMAAHASLLGIAAVAAITVGAPALLAVTIAAKIPDKYGLFIMIGLAFLMPLVWIGAGGSTAGVNVWFVYELFFVALFASRKELPVYLLFTASLQILCFVLETLRPDLVFHYTDVRDLYISVIGSIIVVSATIIITVIAQKNLYNYEKEMGDRKEDFSINFVMSITNIIDARDDYTGGHSKRVASCAVALAEKLGMSREDIFNMGYVGLLHDIGKIGIRDEVLNKPGKLTDREYEMIKRHTLIGADILDGLYFIPHVQEGALYHHERYDGKGYPTGLKGEEIPFFARVINVADSYDAMSTNRVYRPQLTREEIIREFERCKGTQFDPQIAEVFIGMLQEGFDNARQVELFADQNYHMKNLINRYLFQLKRPSEDLSADEEADRNAGPAESTSAVGLLRALEQNPELAGVHGYIRSLTGRNTAEPLLLRISLAPVDQGGSRRITEADTEYLKNAIIHTIRKEDVCMPVNASEYLIIMYHVKEDGTDAIVERIRACYRRECPEADSFRIACRIGENLLKA